MNETYVNSCSSKGFNENKERTKNSKWRFSGFLVEQKHAFTLICMMLLINFSAFATTCPNAISIDHNSLPTGQAVVCGSSNDLSSTTIVATGVTCSTSYYGGIEALYKFTPLTSGSFNIAYSGQTWTGIIVFQGCPTTAGSTRVACLTSSAAAKNVNVTLVAGTEYFIMFDTFPSPPTACPGTFTMTGPPPPSDFPPTCATTFGPADTATNVVRNPTLTTSGYTNGPTSFALYLGTTPDPAFFGTYTSANIVPGALAANTTYYWKVLPSNNIGAANNCSVQSFTTGTGFNYCTAVPTSIDGQGITNVQIAGFANPNVAATTYQNFTALEGPQLGLGTSNEISVTLQSGFTWRVRVFIDFNQDGAFDLTTENFNIGLASNANPTTVTSSILVPMGALLGTTRMRVVGMDNDTGNDPCYSGSFANVEDYTVTITPPPACLGANTLTTSNVSSSAAGLFWVDPNQTPASSYMIEYGVTGFTLGSGTQITVDSNPYGLMGLTPNTNYSFRVKTICSPGVEGAWSGLGNFKTLCENFDLPFTENFNSTSTGFVTNPNFIPSCWNFVDTGAGNVYNYAFGTPFSAPNHFLMDNSSDNVGNYMLISPQVNELGGALVSFYAYGAGSGYTIQVGTMSVSNDPSTFTLVETIDLTGSTTSHSLYAVTLPATSDGFLAFRHGLGGTFRTIYLDDITVQVPPVDPPSCVPTSTPLDAATNVAYNPTITWTGASGFPDSYDIYFGTDPDPAFVTNVGSTEFSYTPGLLTPNATYYYKIVPKSENGEAIGCAVQSFTTGTSLSYCAAIPTSVDEQGITNVQIVGFSNPNISTSTYQDFTSLSGPQLELGSTNDITVSLQTGFTYRVRVFIDFNKDGVFDLTTENFNLGLSSNTNPTSISNTITIPMDATLGQTAMRIVGSDNNDLNDPCYNSFWANVEDYTVNIIPAPTCPSPTDITTSNIGPNYASIGWTSSPEVASYQIEYGTTGFAQGNGIILGDITTTTPYLISGLTPVTSYQYYIRSVCDGDDFGNWVGPFSFSTTVICPEPTLATATVASSTSVTVAWSSGAETEWIIEYGIDGFTPGTGTEVIANANPFLLEDLLPNTNYDVYVYAVCGVEDISFASNAASVFTGACLPVYSFGTGFGDLIANVSIAGTTLANNTGTTAGGPSYTFFSGLPNLTAELAQGSTYTVSVSVGSFGDQNIAAWVDFNNNLTFDPSERIGFTTAPIGGFGQATFQIVLPLDAPLGNFTLRIRDVYALAGDQIDPCASYGFGETEDYTITVVPAPPTTALIAADCGSTVNSAFYDYLDFEAIPNAQEYRVRLVNTTTTTTQFLTVPATSTQFRLHDLANFNYTYGATYAISISTKINEAFGPYGAVCNVTLTADPLTQMETLCGTTVPNINSNVFFRFVPYATNYRYSVTNTLTDEEVFVESVNRFFRFTDMPEYEFGTTYSIKCQVKINNVYGSFGPACNLTTVAGVTSKLRNQFCNITLTNKYQNIYADVVAGAPGYRFRVTNGAVQNVVERTDSRFDFSMIPATALLDGTAYTIDVAVQFNGVWGNYGSLCTVTTPAYVPPTAQLRTQFCNTNVTSVGQNVFSTFVVGATQYRFRVVNVAANLDVEVVRPDTRFSLAFVQGIAPSTTYSVTVASFVNNQWLPYGPACNLTTPALPTIQLRPQFCNTNLAALNSNFFAVFTSGAVEYRFKTTVNGQEVVVNRPDSRCFLTAFGAVETNVTYPVQVAYRIGNVWSAYGATCNLIVFSPVPVITLTEASCGATIAPFDLFTAQTVPNATAYRFRAIVDGVAYSFESANNEGDAFSFLFPSEEGTYQIAAAAKVNNIWGEYGATCPVTFSYEAATRVIEDANITSAVAYPNPFDAGFALQFNTESASVINVTIYDMTGKLVEKQVISDLDDSRIFGANLAAGVYNVHLAQDNVTHVVRVVKK
ncbi:MAG: GEVED domain-containing protein [Flavobacterium sp.]